jgi:hypothetical protein
MTEVKCDVCQRPASTHVRRKWPSKAMKLNVCGYHLRSYLTSEYIRTPLGTPPKSGKGGYAPPKQAHGYAPIEP